jgi:hypothetical protein
LDQKVDFGDEFFSRPIMLQLLMLFTTDAKNIFEENGWKKGLPGITQDLHFLSEKVVDFKNRTTNFTEGEVSIKYLNQFRSEIFIVDIVENNYFGMKITSAKINFEGNLIVRLIIEFNLIQTLD